MNQSKVAIVVLVLFAVLFAATLGAGLSKPSSASDADSFSQDGKVAGALNALIVPLSPKVELDSPVFDIQSQQTFIDPKTGRASIIIPPSRKPMRRAVFQLESGQLVRLAYTDRTPDAPDDLKVQERDLTSDDKEQSIIALRSGGEITLTCLSFVNCQVVLR